MLLNKEIFREPLIPVTIRDQTSSGNETKIREQKARSFYKMCRNVSRILRGNSITQDKKFRPILQSNDPFYENVLYMQM